MSPFDFVRLATALYGALLVWVGTLELLMFAGGI